MTYYIHHYFCISIVLGLSRAFWLGSRRNLGRESHLLIEAVNHSYTYHIIRSSCAHLPILINIAISSSWWRDGISSQYKLIYMRGILVLTTIQLSDLFTGFPSGRRGILATVSCYRSQRCAHRSSWELSWWNITCIDPTMRHGTDAAENSLPTLLTGDLQTCQRPVVWISHSFKRLLQVLQFQAGTLGRPPFHVGQKGYYETCIYLSTSYKRTNAHAGRACICSNHHLSLQYNAQKPRVANCVPSMTRICLWPNMINNEMRGISWNPFFYSDRKVGRKGLSAGQI